MFDQVCDESITNYDLYLNAVEPLISACLTGTRVTCFAYGQTGSGKTFTMMGMTKKDQVIPGLFLLAAEDIFKRIYAVD